MPHEFLDDLKLRRKLRIKTRLEFETAWRIGTGKEGATMSDLGVLLDSLGHPLLPGTSIKGKLRSTCEVLAHALNLSACLLNVAASGVNCVSDINYYKNKAIKDAHKKAIGDGPNEQLQWIDANTCDVCKLFGSPVRAARLRCGDGKLVDSTVEVVQIRDGVVLDRDSHTAVDGLKYDYEVIPAGTVFEIQLDLDNPTPAEEALLGAALMEWTAGSSLGGFVSRGLGRFRLQIVDVQEVQFANPAQRLRYLTNSDPDKRFTGVGEPENYFIQQINTLLEGKN